MIIRNVTFSGRKARLGYEGRSGGDGKKSQILMGAHNQFIFIRINGNLSGQSRIRVRKGAIEAGGDKMKRIHLYKCVKLGNETCKYHN